MTRHPILAQALADAAIDVEHAIVASTVLDRVLILPGCSERDADAAAIFLLEQARALDPARLAQAGQALVEALTTTPDTDDPDEAAAVDREHAAAVQDARPTNDFTFRRTRDGGVVGRLRLAPYSAAVFDRWLQRADQPHTGSDGFEDQRPAPQRRADTLVDDLVGCLARGPVGDGASDRASRRPGIPAVQIGVTVTYDALHARLGDAVLDTGGPLEPSELRRVLCDAHVLPVVLGGDGRPLDVGRATRTWTPGQRRAVIARDRGCSAPGCDRPPSACQVHHLREWEHGGRTDVSNGALLCLYHHQQVHRQGWKVVLAANGRPAFRPPRSIDPDQRPRQHHRYLLHTVPLRT